MPVLHKISQHRRRFPYEMIFLRTLHLKRSRTLYVLKKSREILRPPPPPRWERQGRRFKMAEILASETKMGPVNKDCSRIFCQTIIFFMCITIHLKKAFFDSDIFTKSPNISSERPNFFGFKWRKNLAGSWKGGSSQESNSKLVWPPPDGN